MILPVVLAVAAGVTILAHIAPFPFLIDAVSGSTTVWRGPDTPGAKTIYLTFDDGPNPTATPELLDLLKQKDVRATFFLIDKHITPESAPIVRRMFAEGHSVGQHTGRRWLFLRTPSHIEAMLASGADRMEQLTGYRPCPLFRPHAGWRSLSMMSGIRSAGHKLVGWSWMNWDWVRFRERTGPRVAAQVISHAAPGNIVIIHDGNHRNPRAERRYAIYAAARIIDELRKQGYQFSTLCQTALPLSSSRAAPASTYQEARREW